MNMKNRFIQLSIIAAVFFGAGHSATASTVYCSNCGTKYTQLFNRFQLVKQVTEQAHTYNFILRRLEVAYQNTKHLNHNFLSGPGSTIMRLHLKLNQDAKLGNRIVGIMRDIEKEFPGYTHHLGQTDGTQRRETYRKWDATNRENVAAAFAAIGENRKDLETEGEVLRRMQNAARTTQGQKEALDLANQLALKQLEQNQRLQILISEQMELFGKWVLAQQEEREIAKAEGDDLEAEGYAPGITRDSYMKRQPGEYPLYKRENDKSGIQ